MYRQIIFNIMKYCFFAVDLGATSGRTILGTFTPQGLELQDVNRFPNHLIEVGGHYYWDIYELYRHILEGLKLAAHMDDVQITSIGIDTWGVDFVCVGKMTVDCFASPILIVIRIPWGLLRHSSPVFPVSKFMDGQVFRS